MEKTVSKVRIMSTILERTSWTAMFR